MLKNPNWKEKIKPNLGQGEKNIRNFLQIFAVLVFVFILVVLYASLYAGQRPLTILAAVCLVLIFSSWMKISPGFYNSVHQRRRLIPLGEKTDKKVMLDNIYDTATPFGLPIQNKIGPFTFHAPIYVLDEIGWIVYFYIKNENVYIRCKTIKAMAFEARNYRNSKLLKMFLNDLVKLYNFIINTKRKPSQNELDYIFENINAFIETEEP